MPLLKKRVILILLISVLLLGMALQGCRIFHHSKAEKATRTEQNNEKKFDNQYEKGKEHIYKIQSKETKERMKASKKQADRLNRKMRKASGKKGCH
jgi:Tfp pilus assembly protein PilO